MKRRSSAGRALIISSSVLFMVAGVAALVQAGPMVDAFQRWGYSAAFRNVIGGVQLLGGALLLLPSARRLAALALSLVMLGAVFTHLLHGSPWFALVPLTVLVLLGWVAKPRAARGVTFIRPGQLRPPDTLPSAR